MGGKGDSNCRAGAEEISESAGGNAQLIQVRNCDVAILLGHGQERHIGYVVCARIIAVEEIEKFHEGNQRPAVVKVEGAATRRSA